jgi:Big-like domain-containing protein
MSHTTRFVRRAFALLLAGAIGCSGDLLMPEPPGGGDNVALTKVEGDGQTGTVGDTLEAPLVVQVLTARDEPAVGRRVAFVVTSDPAAGEVSPDTAFTDDNGEATAQWVLGTAPGPHVVVAQLVGGESENQVAQFHVTAEAAEPDTLRAISELSQVGRRARAVETAPAVHVVDRFGNPVPNTPVAWQVTAGEGRVEEAITATDADGNAAASWTLGNRLGLHRLTATVGHVGGSPVTFSATVLF